MEKKQETGTTGASGGFSHKERWAIEQTRANQLEREVAKLRDTVALQAETIRKLEGDVGRVWGR